MTYFAIFFYFERIIFLHFSVYLEQLEEEVLFQISMFITVYLMDLEQRPNESYLSAFGQALLRRRMAQSTVACFLMGIDVKLNTASGTNQSES